MGCVSDILQAGVGELTEIWSGTRNLAKTTMMAGTGAL